MKIKRETLFAAKDRAELYDERLDLTYSGRAMYGRHCVGIVTDNPGAAGRFEAALAAELVLVDLEDTGQYWPTDVIDELMTKMGHLPDSRQDSMGLSSIVYWPGLECEDADVAFEDLTPEQRFRYVDACDQGAGHEDAMEAALS